MSQTLGQMLLAHRKSLKLSAEAVGSKLGVSRNWIQRLEGDVFELRFSNVTRVAQAYDIDQLEIMRILAPGQLEAFRRTIRNDTTLQIKPSPEFWDELSSLRNEVKSLGALVLALTEELAETHAAAASAARRAGRVERQLAPLTEQLAMTARDFERAREHDAAYLPSFMEEDTSAEVDERPRAQLRAPKLTDN